MPLLSHERKTEIASMSNEIRNMYSLPVFGFDLIKFLTERISFEIQMQYIEDNTTGLLFVDDDNFVRNTNSHRLIIINKKLANNKEFEQKRRFICAHEYGHFVLHKNNKVKFAKRDTSIKDTLEEQEAEYFAYCFLMPETAVNYIFQNEKIFEKLKEISEHYRISNVEIIASLFNVSLKKAYQRLKDIGKIDV